MNHIGSQLTQAPWGEVGGKQIHRYTFTNPNGLAITITNYGGIITSCIIPDREGNLNNVLLGLDKLEDYLEEDLYIGQIVGRYANRIAGGKFTLGGTPHQLSVNNGPNHLHGGFEGFGKKVWDAEVADDHLTLRYTSQDGEEGYPGTLRVAVTFRLTPINELVITYRAETDQATPVNLTWHGYFNLTGDFSRPITDHVLQLNARLYTPLDDNAIPTGEQLPVAGTPLDFTAPHRVGDRINLLHMGYDHNFALDKTHDGPAAILTEPITGRQVEVFTTQPGMQFYTGNFLDGKHFAKHTGLCLETQHFPDSPNKPGFPNTILKPGQVFESETRYKFSANH